MRKSMSRRDFLNLSAGTAVALSLAGCVPSTATDSSSPGEAPAGDVVEIVYYDTDESGAGEAGIAVYESVATKFSELNPQIKVIYQPALGSASEYLITGMAAGDAPDIFFHFIDFGRQIMESNQMLPLQDFIEPADLEDFLEQQLIAMRIDAALFALPKYISTNTMAYNKTLLEQAGVAVPDPAKWDWPAFFASVKQAAEGLGESELGKLFGYWVNDSYIEHWIWQNGGEVMDAPILGRQCLLDQPAAIQALQPHYDMRWVDQWAPTPAEVEGLGWTNSFQTGRFAFHEPHSWMVSDLIRSNQFEWDFIALPTGPVTQASMVFNDAWSVWAGSGHPEQAVEFLKYLTSAENEKEMMLSVHGWLPARKSLFEAWNTESLGAQEGYNVAAFTAGLEFARQDPYFRENAQVQEIWGPIWEQIWTTGDLPLEEGLVTLTAQVNEFLATLA